jgi:hypothetical protein
MQWKMDVSFGTWNVRRDYRAASLKTIASELAMYKRSDRMKVVAHFPVEMGILVIMDRLFLYIRESHQQLRW